MASVNIQKVKGGQCLGLVRHDYRIGKNHTNEHIDSSIKNNIILTFTSKYGKVTKWSFENAKRRYIERLTELDSKEGQNKRKDRVEVLAINIPSPENATREQQNLFFGEVTKYLVKRFGLSNTVSSIVHYDEVHEYSKKGTEGQIERVESRPHLHFKTFAVDKKGKFNAKDLTSRKNLIEIQNDIDGIAKNMGLRFHTNEKTKSKKTVESLKNESKALEELDNRITMKANQLEELEQKITDAAAVLEVMQPTQQDIAILELDKEIDKEIEQLEQELKGVFDDKYPIHYISEKSIIEFNNTNRKNEEFSIADGALGMLKILKAKIAPIVYAIKVKLGIIKPQKIDLNSNTKKKRDIGLSR